MIGQIYRTPALSPVTPITKVEGADARPPSPGLPIRVRPSCNDFRTRAKEISRYYAGLIAPSLRNIAHIRNR